jgi:hypothetical protein
VDNFNLLLNFGATPLLVSVAIRMVTAFLFLAFIIPLQVKESKVQNGLRTLRTQLLISGVTLFIINTAGIALLVARPFVSDGGFRTATDALALINSVGFFVVAYVKYQIYHQSYTPANKELHHRMEESEQRSKKRAQKHKV